MGLTSTTIIREYIEKNVAEFDRTILEKKDEYRGILDSKNTDIILLPSGEEIVVSYADISITGSDRAKPQIRVFMDKTRVSYQYAKTNQKRFFLFTIFSKDNAMAKNISNYDPHDYIVAIETNIDNETSRRDLRSMYDFLDEYIGAGKESDFVRCANGFHQSGIYQASFIKIQENGIVKTDAFKNYITYFDSRPYMNSVVDSISNELKKDDNNTYNRIIFGAPGTGKSHKLEEDSKQFGENTERVTFHPNYSYAQFVGTYKPIQGENPTDIKYEYVPGPFMRTYVNALNNPEKKFLLLIEEINRANVAAVFGDVFQLLDRKNGVSEYPIATSEDIKKHLLENLDCLKDKDINELSDEEKKMCLEMKIPENMYIWATMNSADQGVFPMDTAFKRRWNFEYIGINHKEEKIKDTYLVCDKAQVPYRVDWNELRKAINTTLASRDYKINEDKLMGPFFVSKSILENEDAFRETFKSKIIMYLFEDAAKQRRHMLFGGCDEDIRNQYSTICEEFDKRGIDIFCKEIRDKIKKEYLSELE